MPALRARSSIPSDGTCQTTLSDSIRHPAGRRARAKHGTIPGMKLLLRLVVSAVALWVATLLFSDDVISSMFGRETRIELTDETFSAPWFGTLLLVAILFGLVNAVLQPIIKTIGCAAYALTLGLVALVVNGALLMLTEWLGRELFGLGFRVANFWPSAVLGALVIGLVSWLLNMFVRKAT
jgi:putative membrane protein